MKGEFREDLYYRLVTGTIEILPLRYRGNDVLLLANKFLDLLNKKYKTNKSFTRQAEEMLLNYYWYGNVRELKNLIERLFIVAEEEVIELSLVKNFHNPHSPIDNFWDETISFAEKKAQFERRYLENQLKKHACNISKTSQALGLQQSNLSRKVKELNITLE